jgi:transcriptional regulator with XRE-family HTH domain
LLRGLRQAELASRAGVGVATVQRFEQTGNASLANVLRVATALSAEAAFDRMFEPPPYASLDDALARDAAPSRQRAPRRRR